MVCSSFNSLQSVTGNEPSWSGLAFGTLYLAHDKQPPNPPPSPPPPILASQSTYLSIRSTTLRRILSWIPPPLSVDPVHFCGEPCGKSQRPLVHKQARLCFSVSSVEFEFGAAASSLFFSFSLTLSVIEHCFLAAFFVFRRYRKFCMLSRAKIAHQKEQGNFARLD
jgi:hypothetical protein